MSDSGCLPIIDPGNPFNQSAIGKKPATSKNRARKNVIIEKIPLQTV